MNEKEYFSHDYHARHDPKLQNVLMKHGLSGVGLYWCIIETLYEQDGSIFEHECESIAFDMRTHIELIKSILNDFNLFVKEILVSEKATQTVKYTSLSVCRRIKIRAAKSEKAQKSAQIRWNNANAMRTQCDGNASKVKERKEIHIHDPNIDIVYNAYPARDQNGNNRSTGKSSKDKAKIAAILKSGKYPLLETIKKYVADCERSKTFLKNFGTFLNNLPDPESFTAPVTRPHKSAPINPYLADVLIPDLLPDGTPNPAARLPDRQWGEKA